MDAADHVVSLRSHFAQYHNHKETMAWLGVAFFYPAQVFVWRAGFSPGVEGWPLLDELATPVLSLSLFGIGYLFVAWQLRARHVAAGIVNACVTVATWAVSNQGVDSTPTWGQRASLWRMFTWMASPGEPSAYALPKSVRQTIALPVGVSAAGLLMAAPMLCGAIVALSIGVYRLVA